MDAHHLEETKGRTPMSTPLLWQSDAGPDRGGPSGPEPPIDDNEPGGGSRGRWPGRRSLAVLLTIAALLGGGASAGILALAGAFGGGGSSTTTTVVESSSTGVSDGSSTGLDARAVYTAVSPGVVQITATGTGSSQPNPFGQGPSQSEATGSGFVVDGNGNIVTAAHVVDGAGSIKVTFSDGTTRTATVSGEDNATDVAVLKVDPSGLTLHPLKLGSSASIGVGDAVAAIGSPFGYSESVSTGIVSGVDRTIQAPNGYTVAHAIQTNAALNPGNSGGPILDSSGHVVGIADQIATNSSADQSSGVGFAVPVDLVARELSALEAGKTVQHAYLGVSTGQSTGTTGALVGSVTSGGPASSAGVQAGDVITAIDGTKVADSNGLVAAIAAHNPGDHVKLTIRRGSSTVTATATLATQPNTRSTTGG
jgi:putative serine protease PepD